MIAIPAACDCLALSKMASSPSSTSRPPSGRWTPARILTSVDFPAPFSPTRPCTSPPRRSMSPSSSAWTAPKLFWACSRESTGSGCLVVNARTEGAPQRRGAPSSRSFLELELVHVLLHLARQAEACEHDLPLVLRGGEVLSGRGDPDGRRRLDPLQARVGLQHAHRRLPRLSRVVVAVVGLHELHVLVDRLPQL